MVAVRVIMTSAFLVWARLLNYRRRRSALRATNSARTSRRVQAAGAAYAKSPWPQDLASMAVGRVIMMSVVSARLSCRHQRFVGQCPKHLRTAKVFRSS